MDPLDILFLLFKALAVIVVVMSLCAYTVLAERKIAGYIQGRIGPNRTSLPFIQAIPVIGPAITRLGLIQPAADGLKFLFKEDVIPGHVHKLYYCMAPVLALVPPLTLAAVVPFGYVMVDGVREPMVLANLDVGLLFIFAIGSLGVYGTILAGWAANSKFPFLGGIRASAQMISYELAMGLSVIPVIMWVNAPGAFGGFNLFHIVSAQDHIWLILWQPVSAFIFLIALFAETNRLPFDMPESESELVGGFHTEYSSFKFGLFFVAEYAHMIVGSAVFVLLFLGGWNPLPGVPLNVDGWLGSFLSINIFLVKVIFMLFVFIWVRWTVPRFRYDQVMNIGWKMLLPLAIANLIFNAILIAIIESV